MYRYNLSNLAHSDRHPSNLAAHLIRMCFYDYTIPPKIGIIILQ